MLAYHFRTKGLNPEKIANKYIRIGQLYLKQSLYEESIENLQLALKINEERGEETSAYIYEIVWYVLHKSKRDQEAKDYAEKILEKQKNDLTKDGHDAG